jgi:hypothetical protein
MEGERGESAAQGGERAPKEREARSEVGINPKYPIYT